MLLHYAADYGQSEVVSYLISRGANVNVSYHWTLNNIFLNKISVQQAVDKHGISPLLAAIWEGHTNCVKILLNSVSKFLLVFNDSQADYICIQSRYRVSY